METKSILNACAGGAMILIAAGIACAQAASPGSAVNGSAMGPDAGPLIAAILGLALIAQGGRKRRLRM